MTAEPGIVGRIAGISSMALRHVLAELGEAYAQRSGRRVDVVAVGGVDAARRVGDGEAFDFVALASDALQKLAAAGRVDPRSRTDIARSGVAIAVAAGAPRPDVSSESALREAVLRARGIGYSTGPSGDHLARLLARWGIAERMAPRAVQAPPGVPVATLVARGDVELGIQQASELIHAPGIAVVGPLPADIQLVTVFAAAVCTVANDAAGATALLRFLASRDADAAKRRHGMEPCA